MARMAGPPEIEDRVFAPRPVSLEPVRAGFPQALGRLTLGLIQGRSDGFYAGPIPLIRLGPPEVKDAGVQWPVTGGVLTRRPGGTVGFETADGVLRGYLRGWTPSLPGCVYGLTQRPLHHELTRLYLLQVRGREPLPGREAARGPRLLATALDLALCLAVAGRRPRRFAGVAAGYHLAAWTLAGRTLGGALLEQRLCSVDGSPVTLGQAVARLLLLPLGPRRQDRVAGTAVIESPR